MLRGSGRALMGTRALVLALVVAGALTLAVQATAVSSAFSMADGDADASLPHAKTTGVVEDEENGEDGEVGEVGKVGNDGNDMLTDGRSLLSVLGSEPEPSKVTKQLRLLLAAALGPVFAVTALALWLCVCWWSGWFGVKRRYAVVSSLMAMLVGLEAAPVIYALNNSEYLEEVLTFHFAIRLLMVGGFFGFFAIATCVEWFGNMETYWSMDYNLYTGMPFTVSVTASFLGFGLVTAFAGAVALDLYDFNIVMLVQCPDTGVCVNDGLVFDGVENGTTVAFLGFDESALYSVYVEAADELQLLGRVSIESQEVECSGCFVDLYPDQLFDIEAWTNVFASGTFGFAILGFVSGVINAGILACKYPASTRRWILQRCDWNRARRRRRQLAPAPGGW